LPALARKYELLSDLRRQRVGDPHKALRPLASEFPGALRELDCLPLPVLERRLAAVNDAVRGGTPERWIEWMLAYHEAMRLALSIKERLRGARHEDAESHQRIARELSAERKQSCSADFVARVARPPGGRLNRLVFALLEQQFGRPGVELERTLFPRPVRA
jgi:hypothetical protein